MVVSAQRISLRRDQVVAAAVVGAVVVLVAFASGVGIDNHITSAPDRPPVLAAPSVGAPAPSTAPAAIAPTPPGGGYVSVPAGPPQVNYVGTPQNVPPTSSAGVPPVPQPTPTGGSGSSPPPSAAPTPPTSSPAPGCTPDLLQTLITHLMSIASNAPVLAPLLASLGLDSPDSLLAAVPVVGGLIVPPSTAPTTTAPTASAPVAGTAASGTNLPALTGLSGPCAGVLESLLSTVIGS